MELQEHLLAGDLGRQQSRRHVGDLVLGIKPGPSGIRAADKARRSLDAVAGQGADHEDALDRSRAPAICAASASSDSRLIASILLMHQHGLTPCCSSFSATPRAASSRPRSGVDHQNDFVGIARARPRRRAPSRGRAGACGAKMPGVSTNTIWAPPSMATPITRDARRLHLGRDDRHFAADQAIDQGRLAHIGRVRPQRPVRNDVPRPLARIARSLRQPLQQRSGCRLLGGPLRRAAPLGRLLTLDRDRNMEHRIVRASMLGRVLRRPAKADRAPGPIPAGPSWRPAAARRPRRSGAPSGVRMMAAAGSSPPSRKTAPSTASQASAITVGIGPSAALILALGKGQRTIDAERPRNAGQRLAPYQGRLASRQVPSVSSGNWL